MTNLVSDERYRNTRAWAEARVGSLSGAEVIVAAIDELFDRRADTARLMHDIEAGSAEIERLKGKLVEVERLAANNITGCGTCTTIIEAMKGVIEPTPRLQLRECPSAWMRGVRSHMPGEPDEWNVEFEYGDDQPAGDGWVPLYSKPPLVAPVVNRT